MYGVPSPFSFSLSSLNEEQFESGNERKRIKINFFNI